ncbi:MAG: DNA-binding transcriptional LysR family regulator [Alteromonadaceae bacterium]|jgi:DNA-binding transcriptional LysR family regulator
MSISIELMRNFNEVARCGNISQAANHVGLTQPALSSSIKKLEHQLKAELFHRSKKGVSLTRAGKILLNHSDSLLRDWERITDAITSDNNKISGRYSMGIHPALSTVTLPQFLPKLMHRNPLLTFSFFHGGSQLITEKIISYELDFGIIINPINHTSLSYDELFEDQVQFYQSKERTTDKDKRIVVYDERMYQCEILMKQAQNKKLFTDNRLLHVDELHVIASLVASDIGYGILPKLVADSHYSDVIEPVKDSPVYLDRCYLVSRKQQETSVAATHIKEAITTAFACKLKW